MSMKVTKEQFIGMTYDELLAENEKLWVLNEHMGLKDMAVIGGLEKENERLKDDNAKLRELLRGWQVYAVDNTFGDICKSEDVVDSNVVTFCDKHGYRLYTSMEVYGLLHDPNANERILTHDELPETIPCSDVFADIDV